MQCENRKFHKEFDLPSSVDLIDKEISTENYIMKKGRDAEDAKIGCRRVSANFLYLYLEEG